MGKPFKLTNGLCFDGIEELDHVSYLLQEFVECITKYPDDEVPDSPLVTLSNAIEAQKRWQRDECDKRIDGAFDRSYLPSEYEKAAGIVEIAICHPKTLVANIDRLILSLHRLMIIGNMAEDKLKAVLEDQARKEGRVKENAINAVGKRPDQVQRKCFVEWAKSVVTAGKTPRNVVELQGMDGFKPEWSGRDDETLKKWAKEAGIKFKGGRPKKRGCQP